MSLPRPALRNTSPDPPPSLPEETPYESRNFWAWVAYQFFFRIGWQFKMESTLMAGIVSYLAPDPRVMGLFTTLNTLGRNLSPLAAAPMVDRFRHKRSAFLLLWGATVAVWAALTLYLWLPVAADRTLSLWVFGASYTLFFTFLGAAGVAQGALLGKVIPAGMRGRAMAMGMTLSGILNVGAILLVWRVLRSGAFPEPRNYALCFSLTTTCFVLAGLSLLRVRERASKSPRPGLGLSGSLRYFARLARGNPGLARLMAVNVCVGIGGSMLQFYTGFWRASGTMDERTLVLATVCQVFWQSLASSVLGRVADARGNRHVVCGLLWMEALVPLSAWVFGGWEPFRGHWAWYLVVYTFVGLRFPLYQLLVNYLLEVVPEHDHAMALGAVTTVQLLTAPAPILLGAAAQAWGYPAAFWLGALIGLTGALIGLGMKEMRVARLA
ncbi:MAG TPA: hypothetical protein VFU47_17415 [Armatimonadota bacterium]|nr:hypothetical protein [Armatimonadota bacterium]